MCNPINLADANFDDDIERLIEQNASDIPWSVDSPIGKRSQQAMLKTMLAHLKATYALIPVDAIGAALLRAGVPAEVEEAVKPKAREILDATEAEAPPVPPPAVPVIEEWLSTIAALGIEVTAEMIDDLNNAATAAALEGLNAWGKELGVEFTGVWGEGNMAGLAGETLDWAQEHGGELITGIDETTRGNINRIVSQGLKNQDGVDGIKKALEEFIDDDQMTAGRAKMIARTETNNAVSRGAFEANSAVGAREKEWIWYGGPCPTNVCENNEGEGRIPINDAFSSGHMYPSAHPMCRCTVVYFGVDPTKLGALNPE